MRRAEPHGGPALRSRSSMLRPRPEPSRAIGARLLVGFLRQLDIVVHVLNVLALLEPVDELLYLGCVILVGRDIGFGNHRYLCAVGLEACSVHPVEDSLERIGSGIYDKLAIFVLDIVRPRLDRGFHDPVLVCFSPSKDRTPVRLKR